MCCAGLFMGIHIEREYAFTALEQIYSEARQQTVIYDDFKTKNRYCSFHVNHFLPQLW